MTIAPQGDHRICVVDCGLPGDQCACFRSQMAAIYSGLLSRQVPRDFELDRIWSENVDLLYEN